VDTSTQSVDWPASTAHVHCWPPEKNKNVHSNVREAWAHDVARKTVLTGGK